jgi:hypothetical protein
MEKTAIDLETLKNKYKDDSLPHHLWGTALDCKRRRDAFWRHSFKMRLYNNLISVPLLILTSITGLTSVAQLSSVSTEISNETEQTPNITMPIVVTVFGVSSAILTALQKYFRYAERSEHSKYMAKNYGRVARRIENTMVLVESSAIKMDATTFLKFVEEVQKDTDSLMQEMDDIPKELINDKNIYKRIVESNQRGDENMTMYPTDDIRHIVTTVARKVPLTEVTINPGTPNALSPTYSVSPKEIVDKTMQKKEVLQRILHEINIVEARLASANYEDKTELTRAVAELNGLYRKEKEELIDMEQYYGITPSTVTNVL